MQYYLKTTAVHVQNTNVGSTFKKRFRSSSGRQLILRRRTNANRLVVYKPFPRRKHINRNAVFTNILLLRKRKYQTLADIILPACSYQPAKFPLAICGINMFGYLNGARLKSSKMQVNDFWLNHLKRSAKNDY